MEKWGAFYGPNAGFIEELYERYLQDPHSVDPVSRAYFEQLTSQRIETVTHPEFNASKVIAATNYVHAIRTYGHMAAHLDPLGIEPKGDPSLTLEFHNLNAEDLNQLPESVVGGPISNGAANAYEAISKLVKIYCGHIGYEYGHIRVEEERQWLREAAETGRFRPPKISFDEIGLLERLTRVEAFEQFIHRYFPGKTRFSIEGVDILVPMIDEIACASVDEDFCTVLIGMAHRGRLNVLAHVLKKSYGQILAEFKDPQKNFAGIDQLGWTGDVKYHKGGSHVMTEGSEIQLIVSMAPNPSHLEHVNPVLEGMARAADSKTDHRGIPEIFPKAALPIEIHGDAAFPGEGISSETLNLSRLDGYWTGGTIHIITNNQLGYTALPVEGRSTYYSSDLAKGFEIPIIHVNADDPVACLEAARTAFAYRVRFEKDFMIDLVGYRRYGHNEGDEPSFTQPLTYAKIEKHPTVRKIWADELVQRKVISAEDPEKLWQNSMDELQKTLDNLKPEDEIQAPEPDTFRSHHFGTAKTGYPLKKLEEINQALLSFPGWFHLNRKLERPIQRRKSIFEKPDTPNIDWATAESLSMATILAEKIPIRLIGQDVERGTFSQRHAVFHDVETGQTYVPLQAIPQAQATFEIHNSPLSENAALAFEFGYSALYPYHLVIWEAQYGDFVNAAQVMIDEFISSAQAKWEQHPSLVMLLPHGYEGQGPDHSSARPERFLQLGTASSLRIANATTAAQYFHLLRLQAIRLKENPLPLVVFTPKSLLRHPRVASTPQELAEGQWQPVLDDLDVKDKEDIRRLLFCTGKIAIDLIDNDQRSWHPETAIIRIEQLMPFPEEAIQGILRKYQRVEEVIWVQEEPENMGAWSYIQPRLQELLNESCPLRYVGRAISSSPAEGSYSWHSINQALLIEQAFQPKLKVSKEGVIIFKG